MLKRFFFGLALAAIGLVTPACAQEAVVLGSCGAPPLVYPVGAVLPMTMDTTGHLCSTGGGGGAVTSVANVDGSLTVSPTTGSVLASLNPAHANTWSAIQTFSATNGIVYSGAAVGTQVACLGLDASNNIVKNASACGAGGGGITTVTNSDGTITVTSPTGPTVTLALALGHANTWTGIQTFSAVNGIVYSGAAVGTQVACIGLDGSNNLVKNAAACGLGTVTSVAAGCGTSSGGSPITATGTIFAAEVPNLRAGTTYTIANADCGTLNNFSNAAAIAVTLPQAGSGGNFANGWYNDVCSIGAGTATITPTTSTIGGVATLVLTTNKCARIVSDGTNYQVVTYGGGGGGGTPGAPTSSIQWNSAGSFAGFGFYDGSAIVAIENNTTPATAQALHVYNTWSGGTLPTPTNYERGVFDWTTTSNMLTIGTQKGGTGSFRNMLLSAGISMIGNNGVGYVAFDVNSGALALATGSSVYLGFSSAASWNATSGTANITTGIDIALMRAAASLLDINNGAAAGVAFVRLNGVAVASLPACSATYQGARGTVTNASQTFTAGIGAVVAGGGANIVPVFCDGANWRIG